MLFVTKIDIEGIEIGCGNCLAKKKKKEKGGGERIKFTRARERKEEKGKEK